MLLYAILSDGQMDAAAYARARRSREGKGLPSKCLCYHTVLHYTLLVANINTDELGTFHSNIVQVAKTCLNVVTCHHIIFVVLL